MSCGWLCSTFGFTLAQRAGGPEGHLQTAKRLRRLDGGAQDEKQMTGLRRPVTKAEEVARQLRHEIATGAIPPGGRLGQRDVAARYGMSSTPVREALKQLAAEGILVHTPNVGVTVADISPARLDEFHEIYLMRRTLESLATKLAHEHLSRAQLADLRRIQTAFETAAKSDDIAGQRALNYSFHMQIYRAAGAGRLLRSIEQLWTLFPWETLWLHPDRSQSSKSHTAVLDALTQGTAEEAAERMAEHVDSGYQTLVRYLERSGDDGEVDAVLGEPPRGPALS